MATKDPTTVASKWASNLSASTAAITAGVQGVTVPPGQAAARQKAVYTANVAAAADKWAKNVAAVSLATWQSDMVNKGIPRIASGATAAQPKFEAFMTKLLPYINTQVASLPPRGNLEQNISRVSAFIRGMSKFQN